MPVGVARRPESHGRSDSALTPRALGELRLRQPEPCADLFDVGSPRHCRLPSRRSAVRIAEFRAAGGSAARTCSTSIAASRAKRGTATDAVPDRPSSTTIAASRWISATKSMRHARVVSALRQSAEHASTDTLPSYGQVGKSKPVWRRALCPANVDALKARETGQNFVKVFQLAGDVTGRRAVRCGQITAHTLAQLTGLAKTGQKWCARLDSNQRPLAPEANALSS
jgi:hypothetical protein